MNKLKQSAAKSLHQALDNILSFIIACKKVGLGYLSLTRSIASLSGGELQRLRIAQLLIGKMHDLLIVLDEPTASLYPAEINLAIDIMEEMCKKIRFLSLNIMRTLSSELIIIFILAMTEAKMEDT